MKFRLISLVIMLGFVPLAFAQAPTITITYPQKTPVGYKVQITGTNFSTTCSANTVSFNGTTAATPSVCTATLLTVVVPSGATTGNLTVTTSGGTSNNWPFTVFPTTDLTNPNCGLTNDLTIHVPGASTWTNFTPPAVGGTYGTTGDDAIYGCVVKRLTNAVGSGGNKTHYYATVSPMSAGDTKIMTGRGNDVILDLNGTVIVTSMPGGSGIASWDRTNDMVFWQTVGTDTNLNKCTVSGNTVGSTVSCVVNHTFSEYAGGAVNMMDETNMTPGGWLVMEGQATIGGVLDIFLWNPTTLTKSPVISTSSSVIGNCVDNVSLTTGNCVHKLIATPDDGVLIQVPPGQVLWHSPWPANPQVYDQPHSDGGGDLSGHYVYIAESGNTGGTCPDSSTFSPAYTLLVDSGWSLANYLCLFASPSNPGWHVSYRDWPTRAWTVYSAQANHAGPECFNNAACYANPSAGNWGRFENEIVMVRIDANNASSKFYRLALSHTRGGGTNGSGYFWSDPRAAISYDGKYVIFDSNAGWSTTGCGSDASCTDVYLIGPLFTSVVPTVTLLPSPAAFGSVLLGITNPPTVAITLTNTSAVTTTINSISITGDTADFSQSNNCGTSLGAGLSCTITVTFTPHNLFAGAATLSVSDNATGSPQTVALSGLGIGNAMGVGSISGSGIVKVGP